MNSQLTLTAIFCILHKYCRAVILLPVLQSTEITSPNFLPVGIQQLGEKQKSESSLPSLIPGCVLCSWLVLV